MERLKKRAEFLHVARGARWVSDAFVLQARPRHDDTAGPARAGFTASRKVGNAVARNRARRRLKEAVRKTLASQGLPGHDYVVVARKTVLTHGFADLLTELGTATRKLHMKLGPDGGGGSGRERRAGRRDTGANRAPDGNKNRRT